MAAPANGASAVVRTLVDGGVEVMFANPGTTEMVLVEALDATPGLRPILCLHETVCTGAADGYARMAGKPACTLLHLGVGLANGTANLHNARRAATPVVNLIGDMATWHVDKDPLLASDIGALAAFSGAYIPPTADPDGLAAAVGDALLAARDFRVGESRVATIALAHDAQRAALTRPYAPPPSLAAYLEEEEAASGGDETLFERSIKLHDEKFDGRGAIPARVRACYAALADGGARAALYVGGDGLHDVAAAAACRAISAATGCALLVENAFPRVDRGSGAPAFARIPYFPVDAKRFLDKFEALVFCGARRPTAMFGYADGLSDLVDAEKCHDIDAMDVPGALAYLAKVGGAGAAPVPPPAPPAAAKRPPKGKLTAHKVCQVLAATQPEGAILVDESLTSGGSYWDLSANCAPFSHLTLTGGSIGIGLPLAVGCAVAAPARRVIDFQADGSGLYSTPALWTMAAEKLDITVLICKNDVYQILKVEQSKQALSGSAPYAKQLTSLGGPSVDWVSLAAGYGVAGGAATTVEELTALLAKSFATPGPFLVEARF